MDLKELVLRIKGDASGATNALGEVQGAASKFGSVVKTIIAGAAVAAVVKFGESCINAAAESQSAEVLLRNSLGNIKGMTEANKQAAVDWVNAMEKSKSFDDAEIGAALQRLTQKTGSLKEGQEMVNVAMEVARNKHISLEAATGLVDMAYNGATKTLKLFGIEVGPDGAPLKGMEALNAIQEKVKGSGDAWSKTLEGQREQFKTTFGNFQETVGGILMPLASELMKSIMPMLTTAMNWITTHMPEIQKAISGVVNGISAVFKAVGPIINDVVEAIKWIIEHAKEAVSWVGGVLKNEGVNQGMGIATGAHANGGWVGLNGPEVSLVGERGPEYITPNNQVQDQAGLLRDILQQLNVLTRVTAASPAAIGTAINGMGRGL